MKSIFSQVMNKGMIFGFLFYAYLTMCLVPLFVLTVYSISTLYIPTIVFLIAVLLILYLPWWRKELHVFTKRMLFFNITLWLLFGFSSLLERNFTGASLFLVVPIALFSTITIKLLLLKTAPTKKELIRTAIQFSTLYAIVFSLSGVAHNFLPSLYPDNNHLAFLAFLLVFNIPFLWKIGKKELNELWWYALPIMVYVVLNSF